MGGFQQVPGAGDIRVDVKLRVFDGRSHSSPRAEMHDRVEFSSMHDARDGTSIAQVGLVELNIATKSSDVRVLDGWVVEVVEVIEDRNGVAEGETFFDEVGADKTSAASHENIHPRTLSAREKRRQEKVPAAFESHDR